MQRAVRAGSAGSGRTGIAARSGGSARIAPVVGFVGVKQAAKPDARHARLAERATEWLHHLNTRQLRTLDELVAEDATYHDDGMWLLQPARGRSAIRNVWRDFLRSIPDYRIDILNIATEPATNDAFVMWRASGVARLSLIPQRPTTNKPFEHFGATRLHFDPTSGAITDQWTWRGPTADEAQWLLTRRYKPFDYAAFVDVPLVGSPGSSLSSMDLAVGAGGPLAGAAVCDANAAARAKGSALAYREAFGAVPGADVGQLDTVLTEDYESKEATGVWRAVNLDSKAACLDYCAQRQAQVAGSPYWHSEALTPDGRMMFVHFQNVLMSRHTRTLMGLSSGILVHAFDEQQRIHRSLMFRGPMSLSERAQFFNMDCRACGRSQAELLGVDESLLAGL